MKLRVVLKTGQEFVATYDEDKKFTAESFTAAALHRLNVHSWFSHKFVFVQGDNIAFIESA